MIYTMPSQRWDMEDCEAPLFQNCVLDDDISYTIRPALVASILPSFRALKWLTVYGGVDLRVAPFFEPIVVGEGEILTDNLYRHDEDAIGWSFIASFGLGLEVSLGRFRLQTSVWWPVSKGPIRYYPVVSISVGLSLGDKPRVPGQLVPPPAPLPGVGPLPGAGPKPGSAPAPAPPPPPPPPAPEPR
jgi:hypothetical protein